MLNNKHKKNRNLIYICLYQELLKYIPETCEKCNMQKNNEKKSKRNCGFIDVSEWKGDGDEFEKHNFSFVECPNSIKSRNYFAIQSIMFLSGESNSTLGLSFLENCAIMDYKTASHIFSEIKREREKPSDKRSLGGR